MIEGGFVRRGRAKYDLGIRGVIFNEYFFHVTIDDVDNYWITRPVEMLGHGLDNYSLACLI